VCLSRLIVPWLALYKRADVDIASPASRCAIASRVPMRRTLSTRRLTPTRALVTAKATPGSRIRSGEVARFALFGKEQTLL